MPVMEISVVPLGTRTTSISRYVKHALDTIKKEKGLKSELTAMGTLVEAGSVDRLMKVAGKVHKAAFSSAGKGKVQRVITTVLIDDRRDKKVTIEGKIRSVTRGKKK